MWGDPLRIVPPVGIKRVPDAALVAAARRGSHRAESEIVSRYRAPLMSFCLGLVGTNSADDVVNQAMLQAITALRRGDRPQELRPWLFTIARRCAIDVLRHTGRHDALHDDQPHSLGPSQQIEQRETMRGIVGALGRLPEPERRALVAREMEGASYNEIADELGRSVGAVRQMIYRARSVVRSGATMLLPWLPHAGGVKTTVFGGSSLAALGTGLSATTLLFVGAPALHTERPVAPARSASVSAPTARPGLVIPARSGLPPETSAGDSPTAAHANDAPAPAPAPAVPQPATTTGADPDSSPAAHDQSGSKSSHAHIPPGQSKQKAHGRSAGNGQGVGNAGVNQGDKSNAGHGASHGKGPDRPSAPADAPAPAPAASQPANDSDAQPSQRPPTPVDVGKPDHPHVRSLVLLVDQAIFR
ncbi:MAG TPA: sigma-70 family RNA polymerase sigma factor [Baekduia sp.]|nr:sigma-70 family RNA polymerase sigma factor [Baekduia sp.]